MKDRVYGCPHVELAPWSTLRNHLWGMLDQLSPRDARLLVHAEEELSQTQVTTSQNNQIMLFAQMFNRIWPTDETHKYFHFFDALPYEEKLMGNTISPNKALTQTCSDTYEYFYSNRRDQGRELITEACSEKQHLRLPKKSRGPLKVDTLIMRIPTQTIAVTRREVEALDQDPKKSVSHPLIIPSIFRAKRGEWNGTWELHLAAAIDGIS